MILKALKYSRYIGEPREWQIVGRDDDFAYFGNMNLLVGKNASGKSRSLNVIREIANLLSGKNNLTHILSPSEQYEILFTNNNDTYRYILHFKDRIVIEETLNINDALLFDRKNKTFNIPDANVELFEQRDKEDLIISLADANGKYLFNDLTLWGKSLRNYLFANQLEKNRLVKDYTQICDDDQDIDDPDVLIYTFHKGRELFGDKFIEEIKRDMAELGYAISKIDIQKIIGRYGLVIEEDGKYIISQSEISQGMFRALSLFIMLSYAKLRNLPFCLLIDDMGEGLDFESSNKIIELVTQKIENSNIQFFMTTNDRHVMNQIDLQYWSVIGRDKSKSIFYNYKNSKEIFEDFKYTGLNNFNFLSTDFFKEGFGSIEEDND